MHKLIRQLNNLRIFQTSNSPDKFMVETLDKRALEEFDTYWGAYCFCVTTKDFIKH